MSFDGNEEVVDILEDGDFEAVILITVSRRKVQLYTRCRVPQTDLSSNVLHTISKALFGNAENKYPI
jgi:hypothetical protein